MVSGAGKRKAKPQAIMSSPTASAGSSPLMVQRSASVTNIGNPGNAKDTSKATMRTVSMSHAASHAKAMATQSWSPKGKG